MAGPFRWRLGLRPLDLAHWLERGPDHGEQMAAKAAVLTDHHDTAVVLSDDVEAEAREVLDAIVDHLAAWPADAASSEVDPTLHPLDAAGRLVQEDLVLLVERDGRLVVGGGSVCFPNRWDLRSKLGRTMVEVHAPVAQLNEQLAAPIDKVLSRLRPELGFWRLGWGVLDTGELYQAVDGTAPPRPGAEGVDGLTADQVHVRVERETLRRFPGTGCVLFTIRTHVTPLATVLADPSVASELREAVRALPADVAAYKQLDELGPQLETLLDGASGGASGRAIGRAIGRASGRAAAGGPA